MRRVVAAFGQRLVENPTHELATAYIQLTEALGKDGDYAALEKRVKALEDRLTSIESGTRNIRHIPAGGVRLG